MNSILFKIQDTVIKYINIISQISKVDIEVVDNSFFCVARTGVFKEKINMDMSHESDIYKYVIQTGKIEITAEPKKDELCNYCPNIKNCLETFGISMPIILNGTTIGAVAMISCDTTKRNIFLSSLQIYIELIEQISDFISAKAFEYVKINGIVNILDTEKTSAIVYPLGIDSIIGNSEATQSLKEKILKIAKSQSTVLIMGESGTGKEMVATAIWKSGDRSKENFVAINCAAIPEALLESELFGYVKGAFTGADVRGKMGKFELANNGIVFLDEIGDMLEYLQIKLLRVLQERKIVRIGSNHVISLNIRVIAATNKDLMEMVKERKFREDLYYRLNVIPLYIEPLRNRKEEIMPLIDIFIERYSKLNDKKFNSITDEVMKCLLQHEWSGNVRELENVIEFMINMMDDNGILNIKTLPLALNKYTPNIVSAYENNINQELSFDEIEKNEIKKMLKHYGKSVESKKNIASFLGIGVATLYRKIKKYNL